MRENPLRESGRRKGEFWPSITTVAAMVAIALLLYRHVGTSAQLVEAATQLREARASLSIARLEHVALVKAINARGWTPPFLRSTLASDSSEYALESPQDGIYYIIRTTCGACPLNYPVLRRAFEQDSAMVTVVAIDSSESDLAQYQISHELRMPVVQLRGGSLRANLPDYATPITLFFRRGTLVHLVTGRLDSLELSRVQSSTLR